MHRRRRGGTPLRPFQCLRLTATILLRRLRCQEDLRFENFRPPFGGDHRGTLGGGGGGPSHPHPPPPSDPPPPLAHPCRAPVCHVFLVCRRDVVREGPDSGELRGPTAAAQHPAALPPADAARVCGAGRGRGGRRTRAQGLCTAAFGPLLWCALGNVSGREAAGERD